jgi:hypothetical protein
MGPVRASFPFRRGRLSLDVVRDRKAKGLKVESEARVLSQGEDHVVLACPESGDLKVRLSVP